MARPRTITDDAILEAARTVFLRDGANATTSEVARTAGVSEGTVFKRFATKDELFKSAFECEQVWLRDLTARVGHGDIRAQLAALVGELLSMFRVVLPRVMMRAAHCGMVAEALFSDTLEPPPVRTLRILTEWFGAEMHHGRLRAGDPQVAARALLGAVHNVVFLELVAPAASPPHDTAFQRALVDLILDGLAPEPTAASAPASQERGQP